VAGQPRERHLAPCVVSRISLLPCIRNGAIMNCRAIAAPDLVERLSKRFVQIGSRHVKIRSVNTAMKRSA
jgi:hypothetical protein